MLDNGRLDTLSLKINTMVKFDLNRKDTATEENVYKTQQLE